MKSTGWMGLAATLMLSGCGMFSGGPAVVAETTPEAAVAGGDWKLVSCHLDRRGCRDEESYGSEASCNRAARAFEIENRERRAACRGKGG